MKNFKDLFEELEPRMSAARRHRWAASVDDVGTSVAEESEESEDKPKKKFKLRRKKTAVIMNPRHEEI